MDQEPRLESLLARLALAGPQCLLLEGGREEDRLSHALYWAKTANCKQALAAASQGEPAIPCGSCQICRQIAGNEFSDLLIYDGRIANKADEEKPGPIRALRMENMRELKSLAATAPHGAGKRVAIFQGLTQTREEAMNSLLKTLEEPSRHTLFVLLTPQREQILPTLASRSFCLTLPWPESKARDEKWDGELARFLSGKPGLFESLATKGSLDAENAQRILLGIQRSLIRCLAARPDGELDQILAPLAKNAKKTAHASRWLAEAQEMVGATVNPVRVIEAIGSRLYLLLRQ